MPRNLLPRPGPDPKIVNFMPQHRTDPIIFYPDRTEPKHFIINQKLPSFGLQQTHEYDLKWSNNILQHANQGPTLTVLTQFGNARHGFHLIPLYPRNFWKKIYDTQVENTPTLTGPKSLSPTQPENIIKNVSRSRTGFGLVRGNSGFRVAPVVFKAVAVM